MTAMHANLRLLASALFAVVAAGGCGIAGAGTDDLTMTAYFPRAVALYPQSQVRVLGLPSGAVQAIEVEGDRVRVEFTVNGDVPVPTDVMAAITPQSLIGERYIQLTPAWVEGQPRAEDGHVIDADHVIVPVEPDEAFGAIKEFIDSLDPDGLGRLIHNASEDLEGNGAALNSALDNFSQLVDTLANKDQQLVSILAAFDQFTATLRTREGQLGIVIDAFSEATEVLAGEREAVETLVASLAQLSEDGFDLVSQHSTQLRRDIETLTRLGRSVTANLDSVSQLLDAGPLLVSGLEAAFNPTLRAMNIRNQFGPLLQEILNPVFRYLLGDPDFTFPCVELPDIGTDCPEGAGGLPSPALPDAPVAGQAQPGAAVPVALPPATTPVTDVLDVLNTPTAAPAEADAINDSWVDRLAGGASSVGRFVSGAASLLLGVGS
ncbi:MAG: MCE family protein [Acidimicrobiales bacterium]